MIFQRQFSQIQHSTVLGKRSANLFFSLITRVSLATLRFIRFIWSNCRFLTDSDGKMLIHRNHLASFSHPTNSSSRFSWIMFASFQFWIRASFPPHGDFCWSRKFLRAFVIGGFLICIYNIPHLNPIVNTYFQYFLIFLCDLSLGFGICLLNHRIFKICLTLSHRPHTIIA